MKTEPDLSWKAIQCANTGFLSTAPATQRFAGL